jgi:YD repeat-containing protein
MKNPHQIFMRFATHPPNLFLLIFLHCTIFAASVKGQSFGAVGATNPLHFSKEPTESEIFNARVFDEPLVPVGGEPQAEDTLALADALTVYSSRTNLDDFSSLTGFLSRFPQSAWNPSLLLHLGTEYYNYGYYSEALDAWEQAWNQFKDINDPKAKTQADRALGELARMYSKLGRMQELANLLDSTTNRRLSGPGTQLIGTAKGALWMMQNHPEVSFKCGPSALDQIRSFHSPKLAGNPFLEGAKSTTNGCSLAQVADLSSQLGMDYQAAYRSPGAPVIYPAVVHWKVGHYAAILDHVGDRYLVKDYTFLSSVWMSTAALNEEASGYFLVPPMSLPDGWRTVSETEAKNVWGRGNVAGQAPGYCTPADPTAGGTSDQCGNSQEGPSMSMAPTSLPNLMDGGASPQMTTYRMHAMLVSLNLNDRPVGYTPPVGQAVNFVVRYNQQDAGQPATFYYSNLGPKWTCSWISYITDNPNAPGGNVTWYVNGGGTLTFMGYNSATKTYAPELMTQAQLTLTSASSYEMLLADGSRQEFTVSDGSTGSSRRLFLKQIIDPAGNAITLNYDSSLRLTNVTDAIGQSTTLLYTNAAYPYAITSVTDPFGRTASLQYNSSGLLSSITDVLGIVSQYNYGANDFINSLVTPYGTTTFLAEQTNGVVSLQATDPLEESELLEFNQSLPIQDVAPSTLVPVGMGTFDLYLSYRDSYFWSKKAFAEGPGDYTKAKVYHWTHWPIGSAASPVLESEKEPLENRVWYDYAGAQYSVFTTFGMTSKPNIIGRVLDDGTTQQYTYQFNSLGEITNAVDPIGRSFSYVYSTNNLDLLQTVMTHNGKNEVQGSITYNSQHLPLTITDAAGQVTTNTYNTFGQILSTANPKGEITTFGYATNGYLLTVTGHFQSSNDVTSFTYDGFGRVRTVTDTEGYTLTYNYDAADRVTQITHPDGTSEQFVYSNLDLIDSCDRLGRWTTNTFNADRQLVQTRDPLGRVTSFDWCKCGELTGLTDPMGRTTTWDYDVQSRPIAKHYVDGSTVTYVYENTTSRLQSKFDEKGQQTISSYYEDNNLKSVSYPNATVNTPTVTFTYDPDYNRVLTMQDGIGTTIYTYNPITTIPALGAGLLASVSGPLPNSAVTYQYDQLSRAVTEDGLAVTLSENHLIIIYIRIQVTIH